MGASHALGKLFIACTADGTRLSDIPPQASDYLGVEIDKVDEKVDELDKLLSLLRSQLHGLDGL